MSTNYTNNELVYKRENEVQTPDGVNVRVVGGLWKDPIVTHNGNPIHCEIAFANVDDNTIWHPLLSYTIDNQGELDKELDAIIIKIHSTGKL